MKRLLFALSFTALAACSNHNGDGTADAQSASDLVGAIMLPAVVVGTAALAF